MSAPAPRSGRAPASPATQERGRNEVGPLDAGPVRRWTRGDTLRALGAAMALLATAWLSGRGLSSAELAVFVWLNDRPDALFVVAWPVMQVGSLGVATLPALALAAHRHAGVRVSQQLSGERQVFAAVHGQAPDPPATAALLTHLAGVGREIKLP